MANQSHVKNVPAGTGPLILTLPASNFVAILRPDFGSTGPKEFESGKGYVTKPGTLQKLLRQTSLPARHQYGLQLAEAMVTFFESYERELEKYWTKTLFFQLS